MYYAFNVCLYSVYICVCCLRGVINDDDYPCIIHISLAVRPKWINWNNELFIIILCRAVQELRHHTIEIQIGCD